MNAVVADTTAPLVSVIIPARNAERCLPLLLQALSQQTYEQDKLEIIVVDNASADATADIARAHGAQLLFEPRRGQYRALNRGAQVARGVVLAFTDADCVPDPTWIEQGVRSLRQTRADIAGGRIIMVRNDLRSASQACDACTFLQQEYMVVKRQGLCGANVFVKADVFRELGGFWEDTLSGADVALARKANAQGFRLRYFPTATIQHPARGFNELLQKVFRIGRGKGLFLRLMLPILNRRPLRMQRPDIGARPLGLHNLSPFHLRSRWRLHHIEGTWLMFLRAWLCCYVLTIVGAWGVICGFIGSILEGGARTVTASKCIARGSVPTNADDGRERL